MCYTEGEVIYMIKVYGMKTCIDCAYIKEQLAGNTAFEVIDIGENVKDLKAFMCLRDVNPAFSEAWEKGYVGIPCFVRPDGSVTLSPEDVGLKSRPQKNACRLDGTGC